MAMLNNQMVVNGKDYPFFTKEEASKNESSLDELKKNGEQYVYWFIWLVVSTNPSEKWWSESQLGWWHSHISWKNNIHVPKHQPV